MTLTTVCKKFRAFRDDDGIAVYRYWDIGRIGLVGEYTVEITDDNAVLCYSGNPEHGLRSEEDRDVLRSVLRESHWSLSELREFFRDPEETIRDWIGDESEIGMVEWDGNNHVAYTFDPDDEVELSVDIQDLLEIAECYEERHPGVFYADERVKIGDIEYHITRSIWQGDVTCRFLKSV